MYMGRFLTGGTVPLLLRTTDAAGTPTLPQDVPQYIIWLGSTDVARGELPVIERRTQTGTFALGLFLGTGYAAGNYLVEYRWVLASGYIGSDQAQFEITPSGNTDGSVVSQYFYSRPGVDYLVHQVERGLILPGKNPSISG